MLFEGLATEMLVHVFSSCSSPSDLYNLASTCHRFHRLYCSSRKLEFLSHAAETQYGPLEDAVQLVTHNASQPAHIVRQVPLSLALLSQIIQVGRVVKRWEAIYPFKKWKDNFEDRRLLTPAECYIFRRALYRLWLYSRAFHNIRHPRHSRLTRLTVLQRADLLHNWTSAELAEIADVRQVFRDTLSSNVCPSNGTIQRKYRTRFPETSHQLLFNMHLNYPLPPPFFNQPKQQAAETHKYYAKYKPTPYYEPGCEGWGDDIAHYYVVEDMLKLDPQQILWLKDNAPSKNQVQSFVEGLGEWFDNNGETFGQTLEFVLHGRGEDVCDFMDAVADGAIGVARRAVDISVSTCLKGV